MRLFSTLPKLLRSERAAATIEYALILAFIVLAMFAMLQGVAGETVSMWNSVSSKSSAAMSKN